MYDKAHNATPPTWKINDRVWLYDNRVKPGSAKVVTRQRYTGPFIMKNIVQGRPDVGPAYQLLDEKRGKPLRNLVTHDRLKLYNVDRKQFSQRLPRFQLGDETQSEQKTVESTNKMEPKPLEILTDKKVRGRTEYLVRYDNQLEYWCNWVSRGLLDRYREKKKEKRED